MAIPTVTVTGSYEDAEGNPATGAVTFKLNTVLQDSADPEVTITRTPVVATLVGGSFSQELVATSGGDIVPDGALYTVVEQINGYRARRRKVAFPSSTPTVDMADVLPAEDTGIVWTAASDSFIAQPSDATNGSLEAAAARALGWMVVTDEQWAGGADPLGILDSAPAFQAALNAARVGGGVVWVPPRVDGVTYAQYLVGTPLTVWPRVRLTGASSLGARLKAKNGLNNSIIKCGATDGTDQYWHWGEVAYLYLDGNAANQTSTSITLSAATTASSTVTFTTDTAHGFSIGDAVRVSGVTPDAYNADFRISSVPSSTTFTASAFISGAGAGTVFGSVRRLCCGINNTKPAETSWIHNVYVSGCLDDGVWQGPAGTPMRYSGVSSFSNGGFGFNLWADRPVQLDTPSGDLNGSGLIGVHGKVSAGGSGLLGSITVINIKAERHTVPVVVIDDYDGDVNLVGGLIDMDATNTGACTRRSAASGSGAVNFLGTRMYARVANPIFFEDLSTTNTGISATASSPATVTAFLGAQALQVNRVQRRRINATLADGGTVNINNANGDFVKITANGSGTINAPTSPGAGAPSAQQITLAVLNNTVGTITTTWTGGTNGYALAGSWIDPGAGNQRTITFYWDGTISKWVEIARAAADI